MPSGDSGKIIRGSEFETEFDNIATAIATKADAADPTFTGTVTIDGLTVNGNTTLGNAATDTVTVTADIASNLIPSADDTYNLGASGAEWNDLYVDGTAHLDAINFNGTAITATAAELNIMDGVTATTAELNYVDGVTSAIQTQLDSKANLSGANFTGSIDVTGTVTADGLTVNSGSENLVATFQSTDTEAQIALVDTTGTSTIRARNDFRFHVNNAATPALKIDSNNDISFYEDTGTTAKFFWDASEERLGIGTSSPSTILHAKSASPALLLQDSSQTGRQTQLTQASGLAKIRSRDNASNGQIVFEGYTASTTSEYMRIDSSGNVGIGTDSPEQPLHVKNASDTPAIFESTDFNSRLELRDNTGSSFVENRGGILNFKADTSNAVANSRIEFSVDNSEKMRIDSSGNVGIGTTSPATELHVYNGSSNADIRAQGGGASDYISLFHGASESGLWSTSSADPMVFATSNTERMRISSGGGVGIGVTSFSTKLEVNGNIGIGRTTGGYTFRETAGGGERASIKSDAGNSLIFNYGAITEGARLTGTGDFLVGKTSSDIGTNGFEATSSGITRITRTSATANTNPALIINRKSSDGPIVDLKKDGSTVGSIGAFSGEVYIANDGTIDAGLRFRGDSGRVVPCTATGGLSDDAVDLGFTNARFDDIYATNGTIQTSDRNDKQDITELSDAEQRVAVAAKGLLRKFRWIDSVEDKGDEARIHFGIIAQDLQAAFTAEGLDAGRYAMFINSTWTDEETGEERSRMGVRYSELLAFIIAAI